MSKNNTVKVLAFPDKLRLASALLEGNNTQQASVFVTVERDDTKWNEYIKLNAVEREDGSGNRFNLYGVNSNREKVELFIDFANRSGKLTFVSPEPLQEIKVLVLDAFLREETWLTAEMTSAPQVPFPGSRKMCCVYIKLGQGSPHCGKAFHAFYDDTYNRWLVSPLGQS